MIWNEFEEVHEQCEVTEYVVDEDDVVQPDVQPFHDGWWHLDADEVVPKPLKIRYAPAEKIDWLVLKEPDVVVQESDTGSDVSALHDWSHASWEPSPAHLTTLAREVGAATVPAGPFESAVMKLVCQPGQQRSVYTLMQNYDSLTFTARQYVTWLLARPQPGISDLCKVICKQIPDNWSTHTRRGQLLHALKELVGPNNLPVDFNWDSVFIMGELRYGFIIQTIEAYRKARASSRPPKQEQRVGNKDGGGGNGSNRNGGNDRVHRDQHRAHNGGHTKDRRTDDRRTDDRRTGDKRTDDQRTGDKRTGDKRTGDKRTGDRRTGDKHSEIKTPNNPKSQQQSRPKK